VQERSVHTSVETIDFSGLLVIVGGGPVDLDLLRELYLRGGHLVGADSGADTIVEAGLKPEAIIGDFDSIKDVHLWLGKTRLMQVAEQETIDFEKALYSTRAPVTVALGMTGKRFDHTLAALDAVTRYASRNVILVDEEDLALVLDRAFSFTVAPGERVSVHPLAPVSFTGSTGLKYPLDGLTLAPGIRTGTSNAASNGPFTITPKKTKKAPWLLIVDNRNLMALIDQLLAPPTP
jgi:thiamine pyrophosphokinase